MDPSKPQTKTRTRVGIVGSGSAAMGAAYALKDTDYEVHIFEQDARLGGHTNTQTWTKGGRTTPVDTGFIVMNTATYPNFMNFLKDMHIDTAPTEMSFGISRNSGEFEWSGSLKGVFAQRRNLLRPRHWRMILDIVRFNQFALDMLKRTDERSENITIGEYLKEEGYSEAFKDDYLIPMTAAVWSTSPDKATLEFPAKTLIRFMWNHHLLTTVSRRPDWLTIPGGSQQYIDAIINSYPEDRLHIHRSSNVLGIRRPIPEFERPDIPLRLHWIGEGAYPGVKEMDGVWVQVFDHVIFACHADQVFPILTGRFEFRADQKLLSTKLPGMERLPKLWALPEEHAVFCSFKTTENLCYLHSDLSFMPKRRNTWSSWNYLIDSKPSQESHPAGVSLTYNMNILQHIPTGTFGDVLVTMNPKETPAQNTIQGKYVYRHPLYTVKAIRAQEKLENLQNKGGISYCGAWTKYGFHEDGFSSGVKVAIEHLGGSVPFEFKDSTFSRGHAPELYFPDHVLRAVLLLVMRVVRFGERVLRFPGVRLLIAVFLFFPLLMLDLIESTGIFA